MASAFEERGLLKAFDSVHGSSSGACGGAYFAAGQAAYGASVYYEDINNRRFIDFRRSLRGGPVMNIDYLIDIVMRSKKPLRVDRVLQSGLLHVVTTDASTGREMIFSEFKNETHFYTILKASICLPLIAGRSVELDGVSLVDGGLVQQIALRSENQVRSNSCDCLDDKKSE
jgi:predicted patatin/cPLA2 family phospholipase